MSVAHTSAPSAAIASALARPMPCPAAVTSAVLPCSLMVRPLWCVDRGKLGRGFRVCTVLPGPRRTVPCFGFAERGITARGDFPSTSRRQQMTSHRFARRTLVACVLAAGALGALGTAHAQTKLKWAHVYETSEPYHKWSVWAGDEIKKRTNGRYEVQVFPASSLGKESDINQGLLLGTVDIILTGASFAGRSYPPLAVSYF